MPNETNKPADVAADVLNQESDETSSKIVVNVEEKDAVIIFRPNSLEILLPNKEDTPDGLMPIHAVLAAAIALKLSKDPDFVKEALDWYAEQANKSPTFTAAFDKVTKNNIN